jgi:hypothetical protein
VNNKKITFSDLRIVCDYLRAMRNEIAVDLQYFKLAKLDPVCYGKFPRPSRWIATTKRFAFISRLVYRISLPIWYMLGPLLFSYQCQSVRAKWQKKETFKFDEGGQVLAFNVRVLDIVNARNIDPFPRQWIVTPWLPLSTLPAGVEVLSIATILNEADIKRSLMLATLAHRVLQKRRGMSEWGLQSYNAWRWFFVRLAVDKLPGPLHMVEHFDRWAVLVDGSISHSRSNKQIRNLKVIQHGALNADRSPKGLGFRLPTRLRAVNHFRAYSTADVEVFKAEILSPRCFYNDFSFSFYKPSIKLTDLANLDNSPSVLFVGHPLCETAHSVFLTALIQKYSCQVFYKPHPANPASSYIKAFPWTVVQGRSLFPRVDLLISYPSTLVSEYATHNIPAIVHSVDVSEAALLERLPEVFQIIKSGIT